jgi:hypothetical protein
MAYTPKSKILFKIASKGEVVYKKSKTSYIGDYMEFSNGDLRVGKNPLEPGEFLTPSIGEFNNRIGNTLSAIRYSNLKPPTKKSLSKYKQIPSSKPLPTEEDYKKEYFVRYFSKRVNQQFGFIEIDKTTYESLADKKKKYDPNLYRVGTLTWSLKENPIQTNHLQIQKIERSFPLISTFFTNLSEYKRNNPQNTEISENLIANQGELFYLNGSPYPEGALYHLHPIKGPMEGATHTPESHQSLSFSSTPPPPPPPDNSGGSNDSGY